MTKLRKTAALLLTASLLGCQSPGRIVTGIEYVGDGKLQVTSGRLMLPAFFINPAYVKDITTKIIDLSEITAEGVGR